MKIGFLTPEYPHSKTGPSGGIGTSIKNLVTALNENGHTVFIFVYGQNRDEIFTDNDTRIVRIKNVHIKGISWWLTRKKIEHIINEEIHRNKLEIIEVPDWTGISAFMYLKCPVVMRLHGSDTFFCDLDKRPVKAWNKLLERIAFKRAAGIVAVSKFVGENSNRLFRQNRNFTVIPNGIDLNKFSTDSPVSFQQNNHVLYFGTLIRKKGVLDLPHIFNKVYENFPAAKLILAGADAADILTGSASTWEIMKPLFSKSALSQVSYIGKISYDEIRAHIAQATVCVFPSYAEACPVSWLEAMAMKKAIVASDIGWAPEIITDGEEGILVNPADHILFADSILRILNNPTLNETLGIAASERVENNFSNQATAQQSLAFYSSVINTQ
jgi:glycosyltransferase involved in cell wall biosynthesis